ncbi:DUF4956 domain-containing protein [Candidatus Peregrinibacteria bacterium]|nr:DUF4956 domain-containing protein [Candidatus Peregrinibacteria bacterium]
MINFQFYSSIGITLVFSLATALFYYYKYGKREIANSIIIYSLLVFCIVYFVSFENNLGLGIGLLGILSLVRLRSTPENPIDIGFVFYSIAIGLLNASIGNIETILVVNLILTVVILFLSSGILFNKNYIKTEIVFDDLTAENLEDREKLLKIIKTKYGINPKQIKTKNINYLKDSITVEVYYNAKDC